MTSPVVPHSIHITVLHDGQVLLELLSDIRTSLALAESRAVDQDHVSAIVTGWVAERSWQPTPRGTARASFAEKYRAGYALAIPGTERDLLRFQVSSRALAERFALAFSTGAEPDDPRTEQFPRDFARGLAMFFRRSKALAQERLAGGAYLPIMQSYLDHARAKIDEDDQDHHEVFSRGVGAIMADERYLLLSDDDGARQLYAALESERWDLYNWYMDRAKGGVVRSRRPQRA
ncbi:hypothetical protein BJY17_000629 [Agromyces hippuratus]|uniref:Uncharacterized protein n=1 Tax=Agromyces hippuratus TaxID=286438 RepID=A0A852WP07_9MICO|nr:hypothetical protein [Agromyces hippuratus]NYG19882.1 hypothetical protein [Agromyces hippuratus]